MSDPLSYTDAIVSAVSELAKRFVAFGLVCIGAALLGMNIHHLPNAVATYAATVADVRALMKTADVYAGNSFGILTHNLWVMCLSPWVVFYLPILALVCWTEEMFKPLLFVAVVCSINAFWIMQEAIPLRGAALAAAIALLIVSEVATVALVLWWRYMRDHTPLPLVEADAFPHESSRGSRS